MHQVLGGGANAGEGVEIVMVHASLLDWTRVTSPGDGVGKLVDDRRADNAFEIIEVHDHPIVRLPRRLFDGAAQGNL